MLLDVFIANKEKKRLNSLNSVFLKITYNDNEIAENHVLFIQIYYHSKRFRLINAAIYLKND